MSYQLQAMYDVVVQPDLSVVCNCGWQVKPNTTDTPIETAKALALGHSASHVQVARVSYDGADRLTEYFSDLD